ncbi:hypothetical protein HDU91_003078, partial [Kappamyces sp. JEL0680]
QCLPSTTVSFITPSLFLDPDVVQSTRLAHAQTNPTYSFTTVLSLPVAALPQLTLSSLVLSVWSCHDTISGQHKEALGTCTIPFYPLFSLPEIHGWYPIMAAQSDSQRLGELLVKITPGTDLALALSEHEPPAAITSPIPREAAKSLPPSKTEQETFVWTGTKWEARPVSQPLSPEMLRPTVSPTKSIGETMDQLDRLRQSLQSKLGRLNGEDLAAPVAKGGIDFSSQFEALTEPQAGHDQETQVVDEDVKSDDEGHSSNPFQISYQEVHAGCSPQANPFANELSEPMILHPAVLDMESIDGPFQEHVSIEEQQVEPVEYHDESFNAGSEVQLLASKPPLAPMGAKSVNWKKIEKTDTTKAAAAKKSSKMEQMLGNLSLESSERIAQVFRKSVGTE